MQMCLIKIYVELPKEMELVGQCGRHGTRERAHENA